MKQYGEENKGLMGQFNINMTPEFELWLKQLMKLRNISSKAEAIRTAVRECLERTQKTCGKTNFSSWRGAANQGAENKKPRFKDHSEVWE